jgi:hypothetical protein
VAPTTVYALNCVALSVPASIIAGTQYTFQIQGRDFYSNNLQEDLSDELSQKSKIVLFLGD